MDPVKPEPVDCRRCGSKPESRRNEDEKWIVCCPKCHLRKGVCVTEVKGECTKEFAEGRSESLAVTRWNRNQRRLSGDRPPHPEGTRYGLASRRNLRRCQKRT
jgi:hypothetical protein